MVVVMRPSLLVTVFLSALIGVGAASSWHFIALGDVTPESVAVWGQILLSFLAVCALTSLNIGLRWFRWHFLLRGFGVRLPARHSLLVFTVSLPMIATPWAIGELAQAWLLRAWTRRPFLLALGMWLISRLADALALVFIGFVLKGFALPLAFGLVLVASLVPGLSSGRMARVLVFLILSLAAWVLPVLGMDLVLWLQGAGISWHEAASVFARGTLLPGLMGLPGGLALSGQSMINDLMADGLATDRAVEAVAILRWGTTWFAVALGLVVFLRMRRRLAKLLRGNVSLAQGHFAELASEYTAEIPDHVRDRLLTRKTDLLVAALARHGIVSGAKGLDMGCGQGWYVTAMAEQGYCMTGADPEPGQLEGAKRHSTARSITLDLAVAGVAKLPWPDGQFDFVYAINVLHHVTDPDVFQRGLGEIVRVLKPGGVFVLFEMNTRNPLFRLYMSYLFPLLRRIDDGTEVWVEPHHLPPVAGANWEAGVEYFTFMPDFVPVWLLKRLAVVEGWLERSPLSHWSAHYAAVLVKNT